MTKVAGSGSAFGSGSTGQSIDPRIQIRIRIHTKMSWIRNTALMESQKNGEKKKLSSNLGEMFDDLEYLFGKLSAGTDDESVGTLVSVERQPGLLIKATHHHHFFYLLFLFKWRQRTGSPLLGDERRRWMRFNAIFDLHTLARLDMNWRGGITPPLARKCNDDSRIH